MYKKNADLHMVKILQKSYNCLMQAESCIHISTNKNKSSLIRSGCEAPH